ncbi:MAG: hypothetical protein GQ569_00090 [Methylococcaceae bacterium]|nr:hypothetical protein [Methylococcaceae bacterium]
MKNLSTALKITLLYAMFGFTWTFFSDRALELFVTNTKLLGEIQTLKGWFYVLVTSVLLYYLVNREYNKVLEKEQEKFEIFTATISAVQHILNNFLNKTLLFKLEAKKSADFNKEVLSLYGDVINDAAEQVKSLSSVSELTEKRIKESVQNK